MQTARASEGWLRIHYSTLLLQVPTLVGAIKIMTVVYLSVLVCTGFSVGFNGACFIP